MSAFAALQPQVLNDSYHFVTAASLAAPRMPSPQWLAAAHGCTSAGTSESASDGGSLAVAELRRARLQYKKGQLSEADYEKVINEYIKYSNDEQERIGLDVFVHGEPERTDM